MRHRRAGTGPSVWTPMVNNRNEKAKGQGGCVRCKRRCTHLDLDGVVRGELDASVARAGERAARARGRKPMLHMHNQGARATTHLRLRDAGTKHWQRAPRARQCESRMLVWQAGAQAGSAMHAGHITHALARTWSCHRQRQSFSFLSSFSTNCSSLVSSTKGSNFVLAGACVAATQDA
jgi:hypothetical protein